MVLNPIGFNGLDSLVWIHPIDFTDGHGQIQGVDEGPDLRRQFAIKGQMHLGTGFQLPVEFGRNQRPVFLDGIHDHDQSAGLDYLLHEGHDLRVIGLRPGDF